MRRKLLSEILGVRARVDVLRGLFRLPDAYSGSGRSIARMAGLDHRAAQRALDDLVSSGLVRVRVAPAANFYSVNLEHPLYPALKAAFDAEARYPEQLQRAVARGIEEHRLPVRKAYLYGSVARGEEDSRSDVDIAVVVETDGDSVRSGLEDLAEQLRARFGTNFHFMIATRPLDEMARNDAQGGALWAQIAAEAVEFV